MKKRVVADLHGFTLVELLVVIGIFSTLVGMTLSGIQRVRESAARTRCSNNLRQFALAIHQYHDTGRSLPPALRDENDAYPYMNWQTRVLPWIECLQLWGAAEAAYRQDKRFWAPPHHEVRATVLKLSVCPSDGRELGNIAAIPTGFTHYLGVSGSKPGDGTLFLNSRVRLVEILDGTSNTMLIGERPPSSNERYGWWYAGTGQIHDGSLDAHMAVRQLNYSFYAPTCPRGPYSFRSGRSDDLCDAFHFWSSHGGGGNFAFADGSVRFLTYAADPILPALATRAGGEKAALPE